MVIASAAKMRVLGVRHTNRRDDGQFLDQCANFRFVHTMLSPRWPAEIIHEPFRVSTFQDTQCSREREVPAKGYRASDLFIN